MAEVAPPRISNMKRRKEAYQYEEKKKAYIFEANS
jgi:hypothetical protein